MTSSEQSSQQIDPCVDEVLEQHRADHGVRTDLCRRNGYEEDTAILKVYGTRRDKYRGFDGEVTSEPRKVMLAEMPESVGWEVLQGLAEYYGFKLEAK